MKKQVRGSLLSLALLGFFGLSTPGCPPPPQGSTQWLAKKYGHALLQSDTATLNRYGTSENQFDPLEYNPDFAALHVIRLCEEWRNEEDNIRGVTVLIGGDMHNSVRGIALKMIKSGSSWEVAKQRMVEHRNGKPFYYLRNCQLSLGANQWRFDTNMPDPRKLRQPLQPNGDQSGFIDLRPRTTSEGSSPSPGNAAR